METNDLVAEDVGTRSQRAGDLHVPGKAVLCISVSKNLDQKGMTVTY